MPRNIRVCRQIQLLSTIDSLKQIELLDLHPQYESATFAFSGPIDSPYEGYWFRIFVQWPKGYPLEKPKFTLIDKIWNPYVDYEKNQICIDIIKHNFSPALTTQKVLLSIVSLLGQSKIGQDHEGFANPKAASQMMNNYPFFCQEVRKFCEDYSFKRKQVYEDTQRGIPQEHFIKAEGNDLEELVEKESKDPKMLKRKPHRKIFDTKVELHPEL